MYKRMLFLLAGAIFGICVQMTGVLQEDSFFDNMLHDRQCFTLHHYQYEDGSCIRIQEKGV